MKILWLSHVVPYPPKAGVLIRSYHLVKELSKHFEVDLLAFNQPALLNTYFKDKESALPQAVAALETFCNSVHVEVIPAERNAAAKYACAFTSLFSTLPYTVRWLQSDSYSRTLASLLKKKRYDLIHFDTESLVQYKPTSYAGPVILDHHNIESHMLLRRAGNEKNPLKRFYFRQEGEKLARYEKRVLAGFDTHVVCSEQDKERLHEIDASLSVHVAPNGVPFPEHPPARNPDSETVRLLFAGGLSWYPNRDAMHYFLDEIWPALTISFPDIRLDIIGKSPSEKILASAANDSRIHVHGYVDDLRPYYETATAYVCPIRDGGGTKLKVVDAMANAIPLIADPIACEGIDVIDGENVLLATSPVQYVTQLQRLITEPSLGKRIGENGFHAAKSRYSASAIADTLATHYRALIKSRM